MVTANSQIKKIVKDSFQIKQETEDEQLCAEDFAPGAYSNAKSYVVETERELLDGLNASPAPASQQAQ